MVNRVEKFDLKIEENLFNFLNNEVLNELNYDIDEFWQKFSEFIKEFSPINKDLLEKRLELKKKIDKWHKENVGKDFNKENYKNFLKDIDYLIPEGEEFSILTNNVDDEIANICGPQLVVPITNARYAINAANARWGSLYDALYGTDIMGTIPNKGGYDKDRGLQVIDFAKSYLDKEFTINNNLWKNINKFKIDYNKLILINENGDEYELKDKKHYFGFRLNNDESLSEIILEKNNLKVRILIDPTHAIGMHDPANIADVLLESAISTIMDCEDSVATVDAEDKLLAYRNWLGLMKGTLEANFNKNNKSLNRRLNKDIEIFNINKEKVFLRGRSLMLIRNVGHLMTNPAILFDNNEISEGLMDAAFTALIAVFDIKNKGSINNSLYKSVYIVKPKMHGPDEVKFTNDIFSKVEEILKIPKYTVKLGIMDEERRTSVNLMECLRAAKHRVAFINTGFLDRTGDEIHTSNEAGPFLKKGEMKSTKWIKSYEERNVDIGLKCGLIGKAQIGKGMWAMPDLMKDMFEKKIEHPNAGASCAWVPSPTAATIHAMHYHSVNVKEIQNNIIEKGSRGSLDDLLEIPVAIKANWNKDEILLEVKNNAQSILGYVVRWINQGVGCSKVPDINDIGLMEDRATCRISSQILANWLKHEIVSKEEIIEIMKQMAEKVDKQNAYDVNYKKMSDTFTSYAFEAACRLVLEGSEQPSGYTEPILHEMRLLEKKL